MFRQARTWFDKSSSYCTSWMDLENGDLVLVSMSNNYRAYLVRKDSSLTEGDRIRLVEQLRTIASRELRVAEEETFFRFPVCRDTLRKHPEYQY